MKGRIVKTYDGKIGRTYSDKNTLNGKVIVYLEKTAGEHNYSDKGIVYRFEQLTIIGFID